jgi:hypothetical protein
MCIIAAYATCAEQIKRRKEKGKEWVRPFSSSTNQAIKTRF